MNIVVTGDCGSLGRAVVDDLLAHGHSVRGVDRIPSSAAPSPRYSHYVAAPLRDLLADADAIIHLAALPSPNVAALDVVWGENVLTTGNVLIVALARAAPHRRGVEPVGARTSLGAERGPACLPADRRGSSALAERPAQALCRENDIAMRYLRYPRNATPPTRRSAGRRPTSGEEPLVLRRLARRGARHAPRRGAFVRGLRGAEHHLPRRFRVQAHPRACRAIVSGPPRHPHSPGRRYRHLRLAAGEQRFGFRSTFVWSAEGVTAG